MSFQYTYYDLGNRKKGEIVEVILQGSSANVCLLDSINFQNYKNGHTFHYTGGRATHSPVRLQIPGPGHWYVTVDLRGLRGSVKSSIRFMPRPLPEMNEIPLSSIPSLIQPENAPGPKIDEETGRQYDVFISYASEDKTEIVKPLAQALKDKGLIVWYDDFELKIGDSLRRKIDAGIRSSRFGIIVLSKFFIAKGWPNYELDGLITRAVTGEQIILPIWHNITKQEVINYSPSLADKLARNTATHTIEEIATEIAGLIHPHEEFQ